MIMKRIIASATAAVAIAAAAVLYTAHPVKSSDHQDTFNLANRSNTSADITDVFVFPSPSNSNNVVFAMDVSPLIGAGMGTSKFFDPTVVWQFKIAHGATNYQEDQVIQIGAAGTDATQRLTLYGPAAPAQVGVQNTLVSNVTGTTVYNQNGSFQNGAVQFFAGPRRDPFFFDLFAFFTFLGDRNWGTHASQSDPGHESSANPEGFSNGNDAANLASLAPSYDKTSGGSRGPGAPSFNGFASGTMAGYVSPALQSLGVPSNYACSTNPASDTLGLLGGFNVLSLVVEVPKSLISGPPFNTSVIHVWATASSSSGS